MNRTDADCPVCRRYIGPASACPYCQNTIPMPRLYKAFRRAAWSLATVGLLLLWFAARHTNPETIPIASIDPTMNFAQLRLEGSLTRAPRISRNQNSANTDLDDGSTLRLVFLDQALVALREIGPSAGTSVQVQGSLSIRAGQQPVMFIRNPDQFIIQEGAP